MASISVRRGTQDGLLDDAAKAPLPPAARGGTKPTLGRDLVAIDLVALALAWAWLPLTVPPADRMQAALCGAAAIVASLLLMASQRLYLAWVCAVRSFEIVRLGRSTIGVVVIAAIVGESDLAPTMTVAMLVGHALLAFALLVAGRALFSSWLRVTRTEGYHVRDVALVGMNDEARELALLLEDEPHLGYRISGIVCPAEQYDHDAGVPWLGPPTEALASLQRSGISGAIIVVSAVDGEERNRLLRALLDAGIHVQVSVGLERVDRRRLRALPLAHEPLFYVEPHRVPRWRLVAKRVVDLVVGVFAFAVTAPIMAIAMLAILVTDGRPVVYRQVRVGSLGTSFTLFKLRTMCRDAEARLEELRDSNARTGPLFKMPSDPRVTRVGRVLRAASIDELPQLVNVLRGEMSLVGPRPALPSEVEDFDAELRARLRMRPGITGLWQVEARDNPSFRVYRHLDLFYLENWTLTLDLAILVATVELLVGRTIARAFNHALRSHRVRTDEVSEVSRLAPTSSGPLASATPAVPVMPITAHEAEV